MDFGSAFTFVFQDTDWLKKVGIAAAVFLIPLVGPIVLLGWGLEITRRVINNEPQPLPDWSDFSGYLQKGLRGFVVSLAYLMPVILIAICGQLLNVGAIAGLSNADSDTAGMVITLIGTCTMCLVFVLAIVTGFILPAANGLLAVHDQVGAAFRFNEVLGLVRAAPGPYLMVVLGAGLANLLLAPLGALVCGIGILITSAFVTAVSGHLSGQAYKAARSAQAAVTSL
jgi:hypothetical protein